MLTGRQRLEAGATIVGSLALAAVLVAQRPSLGLAGSGLGLAVVGWLAGRHLLLLVEAGRLQAARERETELLRTGQRLEAVGRLAGGIANEFNNLFLVLQHGTDALAARLGGDDAEVVELQAAVQRATGLTRQLLGFLAQGRTEGVCDATAVIADLRPMLERHLRDGVTLALDLPRTLPAVALGRGALTDVAVHLVRNAVEASPAGGVVRVSLALAPRPGRVRLAVEDDGPGVPTTVRRRLFSPFVSTKPAGQGAGLGLSLVRDLLAAAGGEIRLDQQDARGARFVVELPCAAVGAPMAPATTEGGPALDEPGPLTILLVDDEPQVRRALRRILERLGHTVHEAGDGQAALRHLEAQPATDLVVTDTVMPEMDGWQLIAAVRAAHPRTAILRISGYAEPQDGTAADADRYLAKPFRIDELRAAVAAACATHPAR